MPPVSAERLGTLRAGGAALAAANLVVGIAVLVGGVTAGGAAEAVASTATPLAQESVAPATVLVLSEHPLLVTTTNTAPPTTTTTAAPTRRRTVASGGSGGSGRQVMSTGYCLEGITASGGPVRPGIVAMNGVSLGTRWRILDGPLAGATLEATDRIGHSTDFDIWFASCDDAIAYGRRTITIQQVS